MLDLNNFYTLNIFILLEIKKSHLFFSYRCFNIKFYNAKYIIFNKYSIKN